MAGMPRSSNSVQMAMTSDDCLLKTRLRPTELTILTAFPSSGQDKNPISPSMQDHGVRYVSILANREEIEARLKSHQTDSATLHCLLPATIAGTSTATKRRRKSDCPSRPKKRFSSKNAVYTLPSAESGSLYCHEEFNGHTSPPLISNPSSSRLQSPYTDTHLPSSQVILNGSVGGVRCQAVTTSSPGTPRHHPNLSCGQVGECTDTMQQLLAAVRQGLTGSLTQPVEKDPCTLSAGKSASSSSLVSLSPYQSPTRVTSPLGFCPSPMGMHSPIRLPSIGEFFGASAATTHSGMTSPHRLESIMAEMRSSAEPSIPPAQDDVTNHFHGAPTVVLKDHSIPLRESPLPNPVKVEGRENDRKRRSCSMDAATILSTLSLPSPAVVARTEVQRPVVTPPLVVACGSDLATCLDMPDALPERVSVSPYLNGIDSCHGQKEDLQTAVDSFPPPLSVSIDEDRGSIRLRIKTSAWNASSVDTTHSSPAASRGRTAVQSAPPETDEISPIRVKKKVIKFSPPEIKSPARSSSKSLSSGGKKGGRSVVTPLVEKSPTVKTMPSGVSVRRHSPIKVSCRDLLADLTSSTSPLAVARFETLDMRAKFDKMPAAVQHEIIRLLPKSWTVVQPDGTVALKPATFSKTDSKFRQHLAGWQNNLAAGEYDTEMRRKFLEMAVANIDPWKVANFEPKYGDIMAGASTSRDAGTAAQTLPPSTNPVPLPD